MKLWSPLEIEAVWQKGKIVTGADPSQWRKDACDAWIGRQFHGDRSARYGWEIDHIVPNGDDRISNLQPLQWENNVAKGDGRLVCVVTSSGVENVPVSQRPSWR